MDKEEDIKPFERVSDILSSNSSPLDKMRQLMALGYDEDESALMVEQHELGSRQAVYYEQLPDIRYAHDDDDLW